MWNCRTPTSVAALHNEAELDIRWVNAEKIEATGTDLDKVFEGVDGILVPGGFGDRGIEGKISAVRYAREHKIPFFGICLGMQCAVIEFARNVCGMKDANSSEFRAEVPAVIDLMPDQVDIEDKGGTMRLGLYPCKVYPGTLTDKAYGQPLVYERHRHRYEFNNEYRDVLTEHGLVPGRNCGTAAKRASLVPGLSVPSGIQVPSHKSPSAVPRFYRGSAAIQKMRKVIAGGICWDHGSTQHSALQFSNYRTCKSVRFFSGFSLHFVPA